MNLYLQFVFVIAIEWKGSELQLWISFDNDALLLDLWVFGSLTCIMVDCWIVDDLIYASWVMKHVLDVRWRDSSFGCGLPWYKNIVPWLKLYFSKREVCWKSYLFWEQVLICTWVILTRTWAWIADNTVIVCNERF